MQLLIWAPQKTGYGQYGRPYCPYGRIWAKKGAHIRPYPAHILHILMRPYREKAPIFWIWAPISKIWAPIFFFFFFTQVFLRPAHCTLGTLLGPKSQKSQKKQELGCFEHLEFIPRPFSAPPVHFVWASALSKNRKISKKKFFFSGKFRPLSWVFGHQKVQKNAKIGCFDDLGYVPPCALLQGPTISTFP